MEGGAVAHVCLANRRVPCAVLRTISDNAHDSETVDFLTFAQSSAQKVQQLLKTVLPQLAQSEDDDTVDGLLVLLNTSGGDVDAGLAIAEMIASLSMPTVSLVLGGSHSIGVPLAVSTNYSFIVPSGTMMIHPVRMSGMVIGSSQTYEYFAMIEDRILNFVESHAHIAYDQLKELMHNTEMLTRDLGTVLVGKEAVEAGLIDEVGGIKEALHKLYQMIDAKN